MISILQGNAIDVMKGMDKQSVNAVFTSPNPIYHLQGKDLDKRIFGTEEDEETYLNNLCDVFDTAASTVLTPQGSIWVQMGDYFEKRSLRLIPEKLMLMMKEKRGWAVRGIVIWHRTENINPRRNDRLKNNWEYLIWFIKDPEDYYFNTKSQFIKSSVYSCPMLLNQPGFQSGFPHKLIQLAIDTTVPPGGTVLDMFAGTGETAVVAKKMLRNCVLIDIDEKMTYALEARFPSTL